MSKSRITASAHNLSYRKTQNQYRSRDWKQNISRVVRGSGEIKGHRIARDRSPSPSRTASGESLDGRLLRIHRGCEQTIKPQASGLFTLLDFHTILCLPVPDAARLLRGFRHLPSMFIISLRFLALLVMEVKYRLFVPFYAHHCIILSTDHNCLKFPSTPQSSRPRRTGSGDRRDFVGASPQGPPGCLDTPTKEGINTRPDLGSSSPKSLLSTQRSTPRRRATVLSSKAGPTPQPSSRLFYTSTSRRCSPSSNNNSCCSSSNNNNNNSNSSSSSTPPRPRRRQQ